MSFKSAFVTTGLIFYLAYLLAVSWGVGELSLTVEEEVNKISCKPDCILYRKLRKKLRKECKNYCTEH